MNEIENDNRSRSAFTARLGLGLRELDGIEHPPDVRAIVARRFAEPAPPARSRPRWPAIAAAVLAAVVTASLLIQPYLGGAGNDAAPVAEQQDPAGSWRLIYELPIEPLQRSLRGDDSADLEQLLARCVRDLQTRVGDLGVVSRSAATAFTIDFTDASREKIDRVRAIVESVGRFETRMLADDDYAAPGVRFDMKQERKQLLAWLDGGGRERLLADSGALADYRPDSEHLRWFHRRIGPDLRRPGRWDVRYADLQLGVVAVSPDADYNNGVIPAHIQARPAAEQYLIELFPLNMHEVCFTGEDLDPTSIAIAADQNDGAGTGVGYRYRADRASAYSDFSEQYVGYHCALLWNGEVLSAPRFVSRVQGIGRITGLSPLQADAIAGAMRAPLPATPKLMRSAPINPK